MKKNNWTIGSIIFLCFDAVQMINIAGLGFAATGKFLSIYKEFNITLSVVPWLMLMYGKIFSIIVIAVALFFIVKEWLQKRFVTFKTSITIFFVLALWIFIYLLIIFIPIFQVAGAGQ